MAQMNAPIISFTGGMVGKILHNRVDVQTYPSACEDQINCWPYAQGPMDRRMGFKFINEFYNSEQKGKLIPFVFSISQSYIILATESGFEFYTQDGKITIPSVTSQLNDTSFTQSTVDLVQAATITASSTGGTGTIAGLKDSNTGTWWESTDADSQWLKFDLGTAKTVRDIRITAGSSGNDKAPTAFSIEGSNSGAFTGEQTLVATVTEAATGSYGVSSIKKFRVTPSTAYRYWRILMTDKQGAFGQTNEYRIAKIAMYDLWWRDESENAASSTITGGKLYLDSDGANEAAVIQELTVNQTGSIHILKFKVFHGPVDVAIGTTRGGTELKEAKDMETGTHYVEFTPNVGTVYIKFSHSANAGRILDSAEIITNNTRLLVEHPYYEAELPYIHYQQIGDVLYMTHGSHWSRRVVRRGHRSWSVERFLPKDGPFGTQNTGDMTLTPSGTSGQITLTSSRSYFDAVYDEDCLFEISGPGQAAEITANSGDVYTNGIKVYGVADAQRTFQVEITGSFTGTIHLQRSSGNTNNYTDFLTYTAPTVAAIDDNLDNQTWYYRLAIKPGNLTAGTVNLRIWFTGGSSTGRCRIISVTSATSAIAEVIEPFANTSGSSTWKRGEWSAKDGFPVSVTRGYGRLWFGRGIQIWASKSDDFTSFLTGPEDDKSIAVSLASPSSDAIRSLSFLTHLVIGTATAESVGLPNTNAQPVSPTNFKTMDSSYEGVSKVMPVTVGGSVLYAHRNSRKLMQFTQNPKALSDTSYISVDLNRLSPELLQAGIKSLGVQNEPERRIYVVLNDGTMMSLLFRREEDVVAWSRITTEGRIEDVQVISQEDRDAIYIIVRRFINGVWKRYIEKLTHELPVNDEDRVHLDSYLSYDLERPSAIIEPSGTSGTVTIKSDANIFNSGHVNSILWLNGGRGKITVYTSATQVTMQVYSTLESTLPAAAGLWGLNPEASNLSGLSHLEGKTVSIYGDRMDLGTKTVSGGVVTLPKECSVAHVGLSYDSKFKSLKLSYGAQKGTALTMPKAIKNIGVLLYKAGTGISIGPTYERMRPLIVKKASTPLGEPDPLFTGELYEAFDARYDQDSRICIKWTGCSPGTIAGLVPQIDEHDR